MPSGNLKDLARDLRRTRDAVLRAGNNAVRETARFGVKVAQHYSSGAVSSAQLARVPWKHPYSARKSGPYPYGDRAIINKQSGIFRRSWEVYVVFQLGNGITVLGVRNRTSYATFLQHGTKRMVARPIDTLIRAEIERVFPIILARELERALKTSMVKK